jgi:hypothetical protein
MQGLFHFHTLRAQRRGCNKLSFDLDSTTIEENTPTDTKYKRAKSKVQSAAVNEFVHD